MEEKIKEAYRKYFNDQINFIQLVGEINSIYMEYTNKPLLTSLKG